MNSNPQTYFWGSCRSPWAQGRGHREANLLLEIMIVENCRSGFLPALGAFVGLLFCGLWMHHPTPTLPCAAHLCSQFEGFNLISSHLKYLKVFSILHFICT